MPKICAALYLCAQRLQPPNHSTSLDKHSCYWSSPCNRSLHVWISAERFHHILWFRIFWCVLHIHQPQSPRLSLNAQLTVFRYKTGKTPVTSRKCLSVHIKFTYLNITSILNMFPSVITICKYLITFMTNNYFPHVDFIISMPGLDEIYRPFTNECIVV